MATDCSVFMGDALRASVEYVASALRMAPAECSNRMLLTCGGVHGRWEKRQFANVRRGTRPLDETDVGKAAAVASTDVSCLKVELAEVGQTANRKKLAQLQAVSKTAEYTVSSKPAVAALSRASRRHGPRALSGRVLWSVSPDPAQRTSRAPHRCVEMTLTAAESSAGEKPVNLP